MLFNYFKVSIRNLKSRKFYTLINLTGLTLGMAVSFLIVIFVNYENNYENFHQKADQIFRVVSVSIKAGNEVKQVMTPSAFGPHVNEKFTEVENYTRLLDMGDNYLMQLNERSLDKGILMVADSGFSQMFTFKELKGSLSNVLTNPSLIAITNKVALNHFNGTNPIGKTIRWENELDFEIGAVIEDVPHNSHIQFTYLTSMGSLKNMYPDWAGEPGFFEEYDTWNYTTYYQLQQETNLSDIQQTITNYLKERLRYDKQSKNYFWLQNLKEIHFTAGIIGDTANGDKTFVDTFIICAYLILIIACINFANLSTVIAMKRSREVGVRKTLGARKVQLIAQFLSETVLLALLAFLISLVLIFLLLPLLTTILDRQLSFDLITNIDLVFIMLAIALGTGIVSGMYPSFFLAAYKPVKVLKGEMKSKGGQSLRKVLMIFQFSIASLLIIFTLTVYKQMGFMQKAKLGFNKEQVIYFYPPDNLEKSYDAFKEELKMLSGVQYVSRSNIFPGSGYSSFTYKYTGDDNTTVKRNLITISHDSEYLNVLGMNLVEGRALKSELQSDVESGYLLNQKAAQSLGLEVGDDFSVIQRNRGNGKVVGIVEDFHLKSLKNEIEPLAMWIGPREYRLVAIKLNTADLEGAIAQIEKAYKKFEPLYLFEYKFLDESFDKLYKEEQRLSDLLFISSALSVFVAGLGLFGLTAFLIFQRQKEISIRKVLGAGINQVILILLKGFTQIIAIGFLLIIPIAWWLSDNWLQNFAYKIDQSFSIYFVGGILVLITALISTGYLVVKAAITNPIKYLTKE